VHAIDPLRVLHVEGLEGAMQPIGCGRHDDQMDMVRHQAVGKYFDALPGGIVAQQR